LQNRKTVDNAVVV